MTRLERAPAYTLKQLHTFVVVAECGTLSAAATELQLSASTVSVAIRELEKALGTTLCVRQRAYGVQLTLAGERFLPGARDLLARAVSLVNGDANTPEPLVGRVALGCFSSLGPSLLPPMLEAFTSAYPGVDIDLVEGDQEVLRGNLLRGALDAVVTYDLALPSEWPRVRLFRRTPVVLLPASHVLAVSGQPVRLSDLADHPLVMLNTSPSREHALAVCARAGFVPRLSFFSSNFETVRGFVGHDLGWTIMLQRPRVDVTYEGREVVTRELLGGSEESVDVVATWLSYARPRVRPVRAFIVFVREWAEQQRTLAQMPAS